MYVQNVNGNLSICFPKAKNEKITPEDVPKLFRYVEDEVKKLRESITHAHNKPENIINNERTKLEQINTFVSNNNNTTVTSTVPSRRSVSRATSPTPRVRTAEIDTLSEKLQDINLNINQHRQTGTPINQNIIASINASENRTRNRTNVPRSSVLKNEEPSFLESRVNAMIGNDEEEEEEQTLVSKYEKNRLNRGRSPSLSPPHRTRSRVNNQSYEEEENREELSENETGYSSDEIEEAF
jgi:hypothetical protein